MSEHTPLEQNGKNSTLLVFECYNFQTQGKQSRYVPDRIAVKRRVRDGDIATYNEHQLIDAIKFLGRKAQNIVCLVKFIFPGFRSA